MPDEKRSWGRLKEAKEEARQKLSPLRKQDKSDPLVAVLCSDLHLSHKPPLLRSNDKNWYGTMEGYLKQLSDLTKNWEDNIPIICAGDIFHTWNPPPELINFAIEHLPQMLAIPGQHDLPLHNYDDIHKSAYWTMRQVNRIHNLPIQTSTEADTQYIDAGFKLTITAFPWGCPVRPVTTQPKKVKGWLDLAVVHSYIWRKGHSHPGAPANQRIGKVAKQLKGYDAALFGDNHSGFLMRIGDTNVLNSGTFMIRRLDELNYKPSVGMLHRSGKIVRHFLDTSKDVFSERAIVLSQGLRELEDRMDLGYFLEELRGLSETGIDFVQAVKDFLNANLATDPVRRIIDKALEAKE